jgi:type I site-specific restriction endonuclease
MMIFQKPPAKIETYDRSIIVNLVEEFAKRNVLSRRKLAQICGRGNGLRDSVARPNFRGNLLFDIFGCVAVHDEFDKRFELMHKTSGECCR